MCYLPLLLLLLLLAVLLHRLALFLLRVDFLRQSELDLGAFVPTQGFGTGPAWTGVFEPESGLGRCSSCIVAAMALGLCMR